MSHKYYYDCLSMEIWQECWKFKTCQETRNSRLATQKELNLAHKEAIQKREAEELRLKTDASLYFHDDDQDLRFLKEQELHTKNYAEAWVVEIPRGCENDLEDSWKDWLFYHTPIDFPTKKKLS